MLIRKFTIHPTHDLFNYKSFVNEFYYLNFEKISEWNSFDQTPGILNYSKGFVFKKINL